MKNWKKILFNILGCALFLFLGGIILGIIIDDNEMAFDVCFKIILGYILIISFVSFAKKAKKTIKEIKKQNVKAIIRPISFVITTLPYISLWGVLIAIAFTNFLNISLTVSFISLALYVILILIVGSAFSHQVYKEIDKEDLDKIEKNNKQK